MSGTEGGGPDEPVSVTILGQTLHVRSREGEEAVRRVAAFIEEKIDEVRKTSGTADSLRLLLYAAFQIADENLRNKESLGRLEEAVNEAADRMLGTLEVK